VSQVFAFYFLFPNIPQNYYGVLPLIGCFAVCLSIRLSTMCMLVTQKQKVTESLHLVCGVLLTATTAMLLGHGQQGLTMFSHEMVDNGTVFNLGGNIAELSAVYPGQLKGLGCYLKSGRL